MKIGFYVNTAKRNAKAALKPLTEKARTLGLVVTENLSEAEVLITLGGDGTILRAVHEFDSVSILADILGITHRERHVSGCTNPTLCTLGMFLRCYGILLYVG